MISGIVTPFRYFGDKREWQRHAVGKLHCAFACLVFCEPFEEMLYSLIAGVQSHVFFECPKVNYILFAPISRHTP